ncbi:hypothetical protein Tco_0242556 [Tanacetum coccineum]
MIPGSFPQRGMQLKVESRFENRCLNGTRLPFRSTVNTVRARGFNVVKASACWVWMPKNRVVDHVSKNISASVTLKRLDYIDVQGRFKSVMAWMDAQIQGRQECNKEKEESREECNKSRKTNKMKCLEESSQPNENVKDNVKKKLVIWMLDLSYSGLDEFKEHEFKGYGPENSKKESNVVFDNEDEVETTVVVKKKTVIPTAAKIEKIVRKTVKYAEMYMSQRHRGNQRNWNG